MSVTVIYEATPNPHSLKFIVSEMIARESVQFKEAAETLRSPLAKKLFGFPWAAGVFIGPNFVTVTKQDWVDWDVLADPLANLIQEHIEQKEPVLIDVAQSSDSTPDDSNDSPVVKQIKDILNTEIRPAVAMDGGDIVFHKYEDNVVYIFMQGACSGCPSSTMTLKMGIEARLKESIPEIREVVSV